MTTLKNALAAIRKLKFPKRKPPKIADPLLGKYKGILSGKKSSSQIIHDLRHSLHHD